LVREPRLIAVGDLSEEARLRGVDLGLTLSVYNFWFWFDGSRATLFLDDYGDCIALVYVDGRYEIYCSRDFDEEEVVRRLVEVLGLAENVEEFLNIAGRDPLLCEFSRKFRGWRLRSSGLWWALLVSICQQNASFRQGWTMLKNIVLRYGRRVKVRNQDIPAPPTPNDVVRNPGLLVEARVGYRAKTIESVARAMLEKVIDAELLKTLRVDEVERELRKIRGVGSYTARLAIALAFRRYELPPIDRWVRALASRVYGVEEGLVEEVWRRRWGRWSALAVIALTVALDAEPLRRALERVERGLLTPLSTIVPSPTTMWMWRDP